MKERLDALRGLLAYVTTPDPTVRELLVKYPLRHRGRVGQKNKPYLSRAARKAMVAYQNGCCAACHSLPKGKRDVCADHCHATGVIRGLLCGGCNKALGLFRDNPEIIRAAIAYLEHWAAVHAAEATPENTDVESLPRQQALPEVRRDESAA